MIRILLDSTSHGASLLPGPGILLSRSEIAFRDSKHRAQGNATGFFVSAPSIDRTCERKLTRPSQPAVQRRQRPAIKAPSVSSWRFFQTRTTNRSPIFALIAEWFVTSCAKRSVGRENNVFFTAQTGLTSDLSRHWSRRICLLSIDGSSDSFPFSVLRHPREQVSSGDSCDPA